MRTSPRVVAVAVAACLLLVSACGSTGDDAGSSSDADPPASGGAATPAEPGGDAEDGTGGTLIVGMTATNFPGLDTVRSFSEGGEGVRFVTNQLYDGLTKWDLTREDVAPTVVPGLAESWEVSEDELTWTFTLRPGVTFHDGTPWNADAAMYNLDRLVNEDSALYSEELASLAGIRIAGIESAEKVDDMTIALHTNGPWGFLDEDITSLPFGSPTAMEAGGGDMSDHPIGTGPFKFESVARGQELVLVRNEDYFLGAPKLDKLVLRPLPEVTSRMAALRSGEVNWIEVPSPDEAAALEAEGFQVKTNSYPHNWPWELDITKPPWDNVLVRQAANYAIDREALATNLLQGTAEPAFGYLGPGDTAYTPEGDVYSYDPDRARELLAEAGYPDGFTTRVSISTSGSGQMLPIPMNEAVQRDLAEVGIVVELEPVEWASMLTDFFAGRIPGDADAINVSLGFSTAAAWRNAFHSEGGYNIMGLDDPEVDAMIDEVRQTFDVEGREEIYRRLNSKLLELAPWIVIVHDRNPRAMAPDVHGVVMARSWSVDLTQVWVG